MDNNNRHSSSSMENKKMTTLISKEEKLEGKLGQKMKQRKQNCGFNFANSVSYHLYDEVEKPAKTDCIQARARRGQATDTHNLAERARREKIRERLELLRSLVPGCDKITGKAQVLDEIIKYVQSLQNLVEVLAAKLASANSMPIDFEIDRLMYTLPPDQGKCWLEFAFQTVLESISFPQFRSFADTIAAIAPTFASTEDSGELFSGLNIERPNIDIQFLDNMCNF